MAQQPVIPNKQGAILTVGIFTSTDRVAIVEPYGINQDDAERITLCEDLVLSWVTLARTAFLDCVSQDASITFVSAEGMQDGAVPFRVDYAIGDHPGTIASGQGPDNTSGLIIYYGDPADVVAGHRLPVGKTFMPGLPAANVTGNNINPTQQGLYQTYADTVRDGITSTGYPTKKWFRMLSAPKPRATAANIKRVVEPVVRGYVATQRRRMIPH